jgi:arylsulfatase
LVVDGEVVGEGEIPRFTPMRFSLTGAGLTCGYGNGLPVGRGQPAPFPFSGIIHRVVVEVDGPPWSDPETDAQFAIARQ